MNNDSINLEDEISKLPTLIHVGIALVEFIYSLEKGVFVQKTTDWIYEPSHFVAFEFPKRRPEQIRFQFRQFHPHYRDKNDEQLPPLYAGRFGRYKCLITTPRQLACAAKFIELAFLHPC